MWHSFIGLLLFCVYIFYPVRCFFSEMTDTAGGILLALLLFLSASVPCFSDNNRGECFFNTKGAVGVCKRVDVMIPIGLYVYNSPSRNRKFYVKNIRNVFEVNILYFCATLCLFTIFQSQSLYFIFVWYNYIFPEHIISLGNAMQI